MKSLYCILFLLLGVISVQAKQKNVLLICVDDLRPELASFDAPWVISPNIDKLAEMGRPFHSHYVNSPSCGPSRHTLLTGRYGASGNDALFLRAKEKEKAPDTVAPSMPEWFKQFGYTTVSVGKVSHHPGGRGGPDWDDDATIEMPEAWDRYLCPVGEWQHPRGIMHGLAHGEIRNDASDMDVLQAVEGPDTIYPDGIIAVEGLRQLEQLAADKDTPFFLAIGLIKPHLPFGAPKKYLDMYPENLKLPPIQHYNKPEGLNTWHKSGEFMKYNRWDRDPNVDEAFADMCRLYYAACVTYADMHIGLIMDKLKQTGADENTIVVVWGDHGWHLGEHHIWGKHSLYEESLRSPLIIYEPGMQKPGKKVKGNVATLDIFPTLCEMTGLPVPDFAQGKSLQPMLENPNSNGHPVFAYRGKQGLTIRTKTHRMILHPNGEVELYDHRTPEKETRNIAADQPKTVGRLKRFLKQEFGDRVD
jgi:iduronate 2-sulfatase